MFLKFWKGSINSHKSRGQYFKCLWCWNFVFENYLINIEQQRNQDFSEGKEAKGSLYMNILKTVENLTNFENSIQKSQEEFVP